VPYRVNNGIVEFLDGLEWKRSRNGVNEFYSVLPKLADLILNPMETVEADA
jgi:hypothetical protein